MRTPNKILSVLLALLFVLSAAAAVFADGGSGGGLLDAGRRELNIVNPLSLFLNAADEETLYAALGDDPAPTGVLFDASAVTDLGEALSACAAARSIPNIRVASEGEVDALFAASSAVSFEDITVISADPSLLSLVRERTNVFRTGLEVELSSDEITSAEANEVRLAVRSAPAAFCVISPGHATVKNVRELQSLALAVWVNAVGAEPVTVMRAVVSGCNALICDDDGATADLINSVFLPGTLSRAPLYIGHRGYPSCTPANTIASFKEALDHGADVFEIDVQTTADGRIIVMHDGTIANTTNYDGPLNIWEMTLEEIKSYRIVSDIYYPGRYRIGDVTDETVPTLEEVLELLREYPGRRVFIELKGSNLFTASETARIVKEYGMTEQVDVISFNSGLLRETFAEGNAPGMSTGLLGDFDDPSDEPGAYLDLLYDAIRSAQSCNSSINNSGVAHLETRALMAATNDRGMTQWPWTYDLYSNDKAFFFGAAGITTDDVGWVENMYKFVEADGLSVGVGKKVEASVTATTYAGRTFEIAPKYVSASVIEGDAVSVRNGRITGVHEGEATVVFSIETQTASGTYYALAAAPVTVTVTEGGPGVDKNAPEIDPSEPEPEREGTTLYISHLNAFSWLTNDGMIVTDVGYVKSVLDLEGAARGLLKRYIAYYVEKRDGKYIAVEFMTGAEACDRPVPDPYDGFLLFFCPSNRSYNIAKGGKLLGCELEPCGFELYRDFGYETAFEPEEARVLKAYKTFDEMKFVDVEEDAYYAEAVGWATMMGIVSGMTETEFAPDETCTRAQAITLLWRAAGEPDATGAHFEDVAPDAYYATAVAWAVKNGVTAGVSEKEFAPDRECTRAEIMTFLWRAAGRPAAEGGAPFADVNPVEYFAPAVAWSVANGITNGVSDTEFAPDMTCTRAQIVTFLFRNA